MTFAAPTEITPEDPPGFVVRTEAQKAAADNGFRLPRGTQNGWLRFGSTTAQGDVWIAGVSPTGPWLLALDRAEVAAEVGAAATALATGPETAGFVFDTLPPLYACQRRRENASACRSKNASGTAAGRPPRGPSGVLARGARR